MDDRVHIDELLKEDPQLELYESKLREKYCKGDERTALQVFHRVARGLAQNERPEHRKRFGAAFYEAMRDGFYPAGRIASACGTDIKATLINCFVQPVGDSVSGDDEGYPGIFQAQLEAAETMRRGGGVGYDFSRLRPRGSRVFGTRSRSSGPIPYMQVFDRACETVESAGARRGAQMGILRIDHPDIREFIIAKDVREHAKRLRENGLEGEELFSTMQKMRTLSNFNISVAVTDPFMEAVRDDLPFQLVHKAAPDPTEHPQAFQRDDGMWVYHEVRARELWDLIMQTTYETADPGIVFIGRMNSENNLHYAERIEATNPCGEQPLPPYGCCCLGSINLAKLVRDPFTDKARFDEAKLVELASVAVRMLDNVLDLTFWPLEKQKEEAQNKRRIGLGFTGLATTMVMLGIRYGDKASLKFAAHVAEAMRNAAYRASIKLAKERGAFPLFDAALLDSDFAKRLPKDIRDGIRKYGLRNSHLLSIAPTGTISLTFGENVSSGIEPAFAWDYTRTTKQADGSRKSFAVQDLGYREYLAAGGNPDDLPKAFVNAQTLTPDEHVAMQAAVQPYIDTSISKTINTPVDIEFQTFKDIYMKAWTVGLKGCTTFRPNDSTGSVLSVEPKKEDHSAVDGETQADPDRRIRQTNLPAPALASLRWPGRPNLPGGNPSMTYMVEDGETKFSVVVGHIENGSNHPFEVWVNGSEQPSGLGAIAKLLSMDMRSNDHGWLEKKLDSLIRTTGMPIEAAMPPDGRAVTYGSPTAAMAALVKHRCTELNVFTENGETPVLNALMSLREPKTGVDGTMAWVVDINNPVTGDDFVLTLKELAMPDGSRRPYSMWLSGEYPRDFDGLAKLLSLDMRVVDPAWIGAKLRKLANYAEPRSEFMARVPGKDKQATWPSTVAYMAALVLHRFIGLGILDEDGQPVKPMGIVAGKDEAVTITQDDHHEHVSHRVAGKLCPSCGAMAVQRWDGCDRCTECDYLGSCG